MAYRSRFRFCCAPSRCPFVGLIPQAYVLCANGVIRKVGDTHWSCAESGHSDGQDNLKNQNRFAYSMQVVSGIQICSYLSEAEAMGRDDEKGQNTRYLAMLLNRVSSGRWHTGAPTLSKRKWQQNALVWGGRIGGETRWCPHYVYCRWPTYRPLAWKLLIQQVRQGFKRCCDAFIHCPCWGISDVEGNQIGSI